MRILITGGAGFIGSRVTQELAKNGHEVTVLDNLSRQVHGDSAQFPPSIARVADCRLGDVRNRATLESLVSRHETIIHLAAETGTGQSMYDMEKYAAVNVAGTAALLQAIINSPNKRPRRLVVASSRAIYGEGLYLCSEHGLVSPEPRDIADMSAGLFEPRCSICRRIVMALPTPENATCKPVSFYGVTKQTQEQMVLMYARNTESCGVALRYQNVYGPGQSLLNPYTGILAIFSNLARRGEAISIFEDGLESRDFVYIDDVVYATALCAVEKLPASVAINIGSGRRNTVLDVADAICSYFSSEGGYKITGEFRFGDIRHNYADITRAKEIIGFKPRLSFEDGVRKFLEWASLQQHDDAQGYKRSIEEMKKHNVISTKGK